MADTDLDHCNVCNYPRYMCDLGFSFELLNWFTISADFKTSMVIPCKYGDHFTRYWRGEMKLEMEPLHEWYEFEVKKRGAKFYLGGDWEMFANIYNIKQGDELCFVLGPIIHEHLTVGHLRRRSGGIALPSCTIAEYEAEQERDKMEECTTSVDTQ
ncbi:hypothetical protein BRADI_5g06611v3 [Brachypodium distachyon]|uniref:TF-B3 domain-containing protein n=2 Tax=Brachypodium distachyon TaxID=15368 RepID=A0A2K2CFP4_BRADI|nr:hypothetical protein BRADI_5g06611v3 [Brachypodium distachyon]